MYYLHVISDSLDPVPECGYSRVGVSQIGRQTGDDVAQEKQAGNHCRDNNSHLALNNGQNVTITVERISNDLYTIVPSQ